MALTRAQIQTAFQNSLGRAASTSEENSFFSVSQSGALTDAQIFQTISNSQEANLNADPVVRFYQAAFGRVPDQAGLDNATDYIRSFGATAQTYQALANQFVVSQEFTNRFGAGAANAPVDAAYIQALYSTILGRTASAAEVNAYTSGSNGFGTRGSALYAISQSNAAISISDNAVNGFLQNAAQGQAVYTGTLYTPQNGLPNNPGSVGQTFTLTAAVDNAIGTGGNDTINGVIDSTTAGNSTFTLADTVNGGAGTDNLNILITGNNPTAIPLANVTNIENFFIRNLATDQASAAVPPVITPSPATFDASAVAGEQQVWNDRSTNTVTVTNLGTGATIGVRGDNNVNVGATTFSYATATDAVTIAIDGGVKGGANITRNATGEAAVTINSTGAANTVGIIDVDTATAVKSVTINATSGLTASLAADYAANSTLTVTGTGAVDLSGAALSANLKTINASASAGGVSILATNAADISFTGGAGNDIVALGGTLTAADTLVGGAGIDTIAITGEDLTTASNVKLAALNTKVSGFEVLAFTGTTAATIAGGTAATSFTNSEITKILFNTADNAEDVVNSAGSARTYAVGALNTGDLKLNLLPATNTVNVSLEAVTGNTAEVGVLTVNLDGGAAAGATSTVNIASSVTGTAAAANTIGTLTGVLGSTYKITGATDLTVAALTNAGTIDATAFTGKFGLISAATGNTVVNLGSGGTSGLGGVTTAGGQDTITVQGGTNILNSGAGNDTITAQAGTNTIDAGAGNDTITVNAGTNRITGGAGADSITLGSGTDTVVLAVGNSVATTPATTLDTVTNFTAGTDKFSVTLAPTTVFQGAQFSTTGTGALDTDIGTALAAGGQANLGVNQAAVVTITGTNAGTYLVYNEATAGYATTDTVVKLAGLNGTLSATDFVTT